MHWLTGNSPAQLQLVRSSSTYSVKLHNCCISAKHVAWVVCTCMPAWCDEKGLDTAIHPIPKYTTFLEDLLQELVVKKLKDPFGTIRVVRKALSKIGDDLQLWHAGSHRTQCLCIHREVKEVCHHHLESSSARRLSSNLPAAKPLQPPQKLE